MAAGELAGGGDLDLTCQKCGWEVPDPTPGPGGRLQYWQGDQEGCLVEAGGGTYNLLCPVCKQPIVTGITYQAEVSERERRQFELPPQRKWGGRS